MIVCEVNRRHMALLAMDCPVAGYDQAIRDEQIEYGPEFRVYEWFGAISNAARMRLHRALARLIRDGLVESSKAKGAMYPNVKLSPAGEQLAATLAKGE